VSIAGKTSPAITERKEPPQAAVQKPEKIQRMFLARPHPDLLPQEKEEHLYAVCTSRIFIAIAVSGTSFKWAFDFLKDGR
jgi:hypothetical protein